MTARTLFFVECNLAGSGVAAMQAARKLGLRNVLLTRSPEFYKERALDSRWLDDVIQVDTSRVDKVVNIVTGEEAAGVFSPLDRHLEVAAAAAQKLGLPGAEPSAYAAAFDKGKTRDCTRNLELHPEYSVHSIADDLASLPAGLTYPVVVKPTTECGSIGVHRCNSDAELQPAVEELREIHNDSRSPGSLADCIIEEYIDGDEYSLELAFDGAQWRAVGSTSTRLTRGAFVEHAHLFPAANQFLDKLEACAIQVLEAIGLEWGMAHLEFRVTDSGKIYLVEANARLPGGHITDLVYHVTGFDMVNAYVHMVAGLPYEDAGTASTRHEAAAIVFLCPEVTGTLTDFSGFDLTDVTELDRRDPAIPKKVVRARSSLERVGYVIFGGSKRSVELAIKTNVRPDRITVVAD